MNSGFNSNVRVGEILYHVQTEQTGADGAVIDTAVFISGRVIHRVKTNTAGDKESGNSALSASERVERQHRSVVAQIESGELRAEASAPAAPVRASTERAVSIKLNGEAREIPPGLNVARLLDHLALRADRVAIEHNGEILAKSAWAATAVSPNDRFEIVQLVGGG